MTERDRIAEFKEVADLMPDDPALQTKKGIEVFLRRLDAAGR
jgi:hypothetical protein